MDNLPLVDEQGKAFTGGADESAQSDWQVVDPESLLPTLSEFDPSRLWIWGLVLRAVGIDHLLTSKADRWQLWIRTADRENALRELRLYETENHNWPPQPRQRPVTDNGKVSITVLVALAVFHNLTRLIDSIDWIGLGSASSRRILAGEWWRLVTSLTLHSDGVHLAGNVLIGSAFVMLFCREVGTGLGWSLILLSGILGNLLNVLVQPVDHNAVGASTALFGCIGLLTGISLPHVRPKLRPRRIFALAAGFVLLAMLGTGDQRTDVGAHLFGFVSGGVLGFASGVRLGADRRITPVLDIWLCLIAFLAPLVAWGMALLSKPSL